jgi:hypothetical protein
MSATTTELRFRALRQLFLAATPFLDGLHDALRLHFSTPTGPEDLNLYRLLDALADPTNAVTAEDVAIARQTVRPSLDPAQIESLRKFAADR